MDIFNRFLTSASPVIPPHVKRIHLRTKGPRKLALKKNVRRSTKLDDLQRTLQNNSLIIVDTSIEDAKSPALPRRNIQDNIHANALLSVTRYAEISDWVVEVNEALNHSNNLSNEDCEQIIRRFVTERKKPNDIQIDRDLSVISSSQTDENCKNIPQLDKNKTCILISSSAASESFKSACSDVVLIESSFQYDESKYTLDRSLLVRSEPRKKKQAVTVPQLPKTEVKPTQRSRQITSNVPWSQRLKHLCDSDTTDSSLRNDGRAVLATNTINAHKLQNEVIPSGQSVKKQIRRKLEFDKMIQSLTNKENSIISNRIHDNKNHFNDQHIDYVPTKGAVIDHVNDIINNHNSNKSLLSNILQVSNIINTERKQKSNNTTSKKGICKEKPVYYITSDDESLKSRLNDKLFKPPVSTADSTKSKSLLSINGESEFDMLLKTKSNQINYNYDERYFSDISSDYESLEDKLRKQNINLDNIFNKGMTHVLTGKTTSESQGEPRKIQKPKTKKPRDRKKTKHANSDNHLQASIRSSGENQKTFLESLSGCVKLSRCHPAARIFRNNFQTHKHHLVTKLFKMYNKSVFNNGIPEDSPIEWSERMRGTAGYCYCRKISKSGGGLERKIRIVLSTKVIDSADRLRDTFIHELCHAATWIIDGFANGHGDHWKAWTIKAREVFPELPPIKRCHEYVINTKYTYKCTNCGYSFGRHSKSLDLNIKRCGFCGSKFELLINKKSKNGEIKSVPVTPKKEPVGFALFVKENYGCTRTPQLSHAQVMKLLGQKFNELKV